MFDFLLMLEEAGNSGGLWVTIVMVLLLFVFMYFFMIRPQKKQEKAANEMRDALQVGDEVTTIGGIIGKIVSIKDETLVLETTKQRTQIRFLKGAIRNVDVKVADAAAAVVASKEDKNADKNVAPEADTSKSAETADKETGKETENKD